MKKIYYLIYALLVFMFMGLNSKVVAQSDYATGLNAAAQNYGLSELVKAAKKSDPNSSLPTIIEHILAGISMATHPETTLEAVYPGSLAASAISQLIEKHGKDIARMTYRERQVFIGDEYSDPSIIPNEYKGIKPGAAHALCTEMIKGPDVAYCEKLVERIRGCKGNKNLSSREVSNCDKDLKSFYELMEFEGKTKLVQRAGEVAGNEFKKVSNSSLSAGTPNIIGATIKGVWINTIHSHIGCSPKRSICKIYKVDLTFSTNKDGNLLATWGGFSLNGKLTGTTYDFQIYNGSKHHGKGVFNFDSGFRNFSGTWEDNYGHKGTWKGKR